MVSVLAMAMVPFQQMAPTLDTLLLEDIKSSFQLTVIPATFSLPNIYHDDIITHLQTLPVYFLHNINVIVDNEFNKKLIS